MVQESDGSYYYIYNMDRRTKAIYALQPVRVHGEINRRYKSIKATKVEVMVRGTFRTVWTPRRGFKGLRQPGATRP